MTQDLPLVTTVPEGLYSTTVLSFTPALLGWPKGPTPFPQATKILSPSLVRSSGLDNVDEPLAKTAVLTDALPVEAAVADAIVAGTLFLRWANPLRRKFA